MWWQYLASGLKTGIQAYSSYRAGKAGAEEALVNREIARHNMLLAEVDRRAAILETNEAQMAHLFQSEQAIGAERVRAGGAGARTDIGGPFRQRAQMTAWLDLERMNIGRAGRKKAEDYSQEAAAQYLLERHYGNVAKNRMNQGLAGAQMSLLGGGSDMMNIGR